MIEQFLFPSTWPAWVRRGFLLTLPISGTIWLAILIVAAASLVVMWSVVSAALLLCDFLFWVPRAAAHIRSAVVAGVVAWTNRVWSGTQIR